MVASQGVGFSHRAAIFWGAVGMTLTPEQTAALEAPLDPRRISQRQGAGNKALSYIQTHDAKRTANRIFGYDGWSYEQTSVRCTSEERVTKNGRNGWFVSYIATVTFEAVGVRRGDVGYGDAVEYRELMGPPHELASKEAVSDGLKRCLASFGDQFGLVLYGDDPAPPVEAPKPASDAQVEKIRELATAAGLDLVKIDAALDAQRAKHGGVVPAGWAGAQIGRLSKATA